MAEQAVTVDDGLWEQIAPLLPPQPPHPQGGRPRLPDRVALNGILYVLQEGIPWERLPQHMGYGSGMTCWRRLRLWQQAGVWPAVQQLLAESFGETVRIDWDRAYADLPPATAENVHQEPRARRVRRS